jgi:hypothetical protein
MLNHKKEKTYIIYTMMIESVKPQSLLDRSFGLTWAFVLLSISLHIYISCMSR